MILPLTTDIRHLHQLAWQPAQFAHPLWLAAVGVRAEHYRYGRSNALDSALNRALIRQRNFPRHSLPAVLSQQQQQQVAGYQRLPALCLALGLVHLQCTDYLRLRRYREVLAPLLDEGNIHQLIGLGYCGHLPARLSPQHLLNVALRFGHSLAHQIRHDDVVWRAISITLPPQPRALSLSSALSLSADHWLTRLERLL
ncbi:type III secretion system domain-containing protein [Yersinia aleksiciae]|uniref:type III secretion system domain-containing protein n=1 Tax=Yersinia aleksiciae TaxID=263819 RepID=UPI0011A542BE|nr:type III secretion system domain-containing protein [Yersinia aleksiciae]MDN0125102.1 type III secretion system domain-containing protein [Yersinia aleksiciae]